MVKKSPPIRKNIIKKMNNKSPFPYFRKIQDSDWESPGEFQCLACKREWENDDDYSFCPHCGIKFKGQWSKKNTRYPYNRWKKPQYPLFFIEYYQEWPNFAWIQYNDYRRAYYQDNLKLKSISHLIYQELQLVKQHYHHGPESFFNTQLQLRVEHKNGSEKIFKITKGKK